MRRFYFYKRHQIYYCQLRNPLTNELLPAKSTGKENLKEAEMVAMSWLVNGIPQGRSKGVRDSGAAFSFESAFAQLKALTFSRENTTRILDLLKSRGLIDQVTLKEDGPLLIPWLQKFWDFDSSAYVAEKKAFGQTIGRRRCQDTLSAIRTHWAPFFTDSHLKSVSRESLKAFTLHLSSKGLSAKTINNIMGAGIVALRWATDNGILGNDPTRGVRKFSGTAKKRGILSEEEAQKVFIEGDWHGNEGARLANLLAMTTGMRSGEILALQVRDIGEDRIYVRHSFSTSDGLKIPKNGEERQVPLISTIRQRLLEYAQLNPNGIGPVSFVFFSLDSDDKPMRGETLRTRLVGALESIGIVRDTQLARGICFHGWRHYFAATMSRRLDERTAKLTGHMTIPPDSPTHV